MKVKVNVWQMGFDNIKAYMLKDSSRVVCKERGYVLVENSEGWEEEVWNLLNWSCWNYNEEGNAVKPEDVCSPLDHCNTDVILQIDGTNDYRKAEWIGWTKYNSLGQAVTAFKNDPNSLGSFSETPREYTRYKTNGKDVWGSNNGKDWFII